MFDSKTLKFYKKNGSYYKEHKTTKRKTKLTKKQYDQCRRRYDPISIINAFDKDAWCKEAWKKHSKKYKNRKDPKFADKCMGRSEAVWKHVQTWPEALFLMVKFLSGDIFSNPFHLRPIDDETIPLLGTLRQINKYGLMTNEGQPGICVIEDGWEQEQRAYMSGLMKKDIAYNFAKVLTKNKKVFAVVINNNKKTTFFGNWNEITENCKRIGDCVVLTRFRKTGTKTWENPTRLHIKGLKNEMREDLYHIKNYNMSSTFIKFASQNLVTIRIVQKERCKVQLDTLVLKALRSVTSRVL